jgi:hypothetical protein
VTFLEQLARARLDGIAGRINGKAPPVQPFDTSRHGFLASGQPEQQMAVGKSHASMLAGNRHRSDLL